MSDLQELTSIVREAGPANSRAEGTQPVDGVPGYLFEWTKDGERVGGFMVEVHNDVLAFLGLEVTPEGEGVFRNLCAALPSWAKAKGISYFVVPFAQTEHMRDLLGDAGFVNIGPGAWQANIRESSAVEDYGKGE